MSEQEAMREVFEAFAQQETGRDIAYHERNHTTGIEFAWSAWQAALQWAAEGQEPVAWKWVPSEAWGEPVVTFDKDKAKEAMSFDMTVVPLYAAPVPNADLLAEVERLRKVLRAITDDRGTWACMPMRLRDLASAALAKGE